MIRRNITIINKLGLHARAAAKLVATASHFSSSVKVRKGEKEVDGKSIMSVMLLAASKGTEIEVSAEGTDAQSAVDAICALIDDKFEEGE